MVGLEYAPIYINEFERGYMQRFREKFGNLGRIFCIIIKTKCYESVTGFVNTDKYVLQKLAIDVGVTEEELIQLIWFGCNGGFDWGIDEKGEPKKYPLFDEELWVEHQIICSKEWLNDIISKNERSEKGRERNRINQRKKREREKQAKESGEFKGAD